MNTSNKILAGFFILVFLVPVFVLLSFRSRINSGNFTVVKNENPIGANFRSGNFKPYKVVKLISPEGRALKCNLQYADSLYYSYNMNNSHDSIRVYNVADTLFIQYISMSAGKDNTVVHSDNDLYVDVKLPEIGQLIIDNAEATISSLNASAANNMLVEVYGKGLFNLGFVDEDSNDKAGDMISYTIDQLSLKSSNGEIALGKNIHIGQLLIQADGASTVNIREGATIGDVRGALSDSSTVNASWKYVKKLAALSKN